MGILGWSVSIKLQSEAIMSQRHDKKYAAFLKKNFARDKDKLINSHLVQVRAMPFRFRIMFAWMILFGKIK